MTLRIGENETEVDFVDIRKGHWQFLQNVKEAFLIIGLKFNFCENQSDTQWPHYKRWLI